MSEFKCMECSHGSVCESFEGSHAKNCEEFEPERVWISVKERLPEETERYKGTVLCFFADGVIETFEVDSIEGWNKRQKGRDVITHWQPLPKPPQEVTT